jgi:potassium/hydrogen antiporter
MVQEILVNASTPLLYISYIAVLLLIGIIISLISKKIKIPNILFLLLIGIVLGNLKYQGEQLIVLPNVFLSSIAIIALVMIVFDVSASFKIQEFNKLGWQVLKLSCVFFILTFIFVSSAAKLMFEISWWRAFLFGSLMSGTDPGAILTMFGQVKNRILEIIEIESIINTPLTVLFPFMILELSYKVGNVTISKLDIIFEQFEPFIVLFVVGVGTGVLMGLIGSRIMKRYYSESMSPLALITLALLAYILAENLGGNGVLAVTIMGLFYGNLYIREKITLFRFSEVFANALEILVFILIGLIIKFPLTIVFLVNSLILFLFYLTIRYIAIDISFRKKGLLFREKLFMTLNVQKGIAVAVVAFFLSTVSELTTVLNITLAFMLYSIVLSTIVLFFTKKMLRVDEDKNVEIIK